MAVYVFNDSNENAKDFVSRSLISEGIARFGWSWIDTADLRVLVDTPWDQMNEDEMEIWKKTHFLLNIKKGDWVVYINTPSWGNCITAQISEEYNFSEIDTEISDFRHFFKIDPSTLLKFERNNEAIHPLTNRKLKLRGRYWRMYSENEFFESMENLKKGTKINIGDTIGIHFLKNEIKPLLQDLTCKIQKTHPEKKLETLVCNVFKNIPNVTECYVNGSGWGTDFGADIIVKYMSGLNILNLAKEETLVVQVKSFQGIHEETNAVSQIETAIDKFNAGCGLIITTAQASNNLEKAIEDLSGKIDKPIGLLAGEDVAKFILKFEKGLLFNI